MKCNIDLENENERTFSSLIKLEAYYVMDEDSTMEPKAYPTDIPQKERIVGSIIGTLVGDALGLGPQWYYNLKYLKNDFGQWIDNYEDPKENPSNIWKRITKYRFEEGIRAGDVSQTGQFIEMLLESVVSRGGFDKEDYTARIDAFLDTIDGTPYSGRFTEGVIRSLWQQRKKHGISWEDHEISGPSATTEGASRSVVLSGRYRDPAELAEIAYSELRLFYNDSFTIGTQIGHALLVQAIINNVPLLEMTPYMQRQIGDNPEIMKYVKHYDILFTSETAQCAWIKEVQIDPAQFVSFVYGRHCQHTMVIPAATYLAFKFPDDFEKAVLSAINGGGNGMARASLTGGLVGAMVGINGIPKRFIKGLKNHKHYLELAWQIAK